MGWLSDALMTDDLLLKIGTEIREAKESRERADKISDTQTMVGRWDENTLNEEQLNAVKRIMARAVIAAQKAEISLKSFQQLREAYQKAGLTFQFESEIDNAEHQITYAKDLAEKVKKWL